MMEFQGNLITKATVDAEAMPLKLFDADLQDHTGVNK
jgi:hypothetical protein